MDSRYAYAVGYVRALETKLLGRQALERLSGAGDVQSFLELANSAGYPGGTTGEFEKNTEAKSSAAVMLSKKLMAEESAAELIGLRYDFYNAAVLLAAKHSGSEKKPRLYEQEGGVPAERLEEAAAGRFSAAPLELAEAMEGAEKEYELSGNLAFIHIFMDRAYFKALNRLAARTGSTFLEGYARISTDLFNIQALFRALRAGMEPAETEKAFADGGNLPRGFFALAAKNRGNSPEGNASGYREILDLGMKCLSEGGTFAPVEAAADRIMLKLAGETRSVVMGPEPVFAYYLKTAHEIKTVRLILAGIKTNAPPDELEERTVLPS